jgi:hypothetical protein
MRGYRRGQRSQSDERHRVESAMDGAMALAAALTLLIGTIFFCVFVSKLLG